MKVEGNLNSILSNYGFYVKLKSEDRRVGELDFRKNYMQSLIVEDFESVKKQINEVCFLEKRKNKEREDNLQLENQNSQSEIQTTKGIDVDENLEIGNVNLESQNELDLESDDLLEIGSEELETENSSSSSLEFLNAVREIQSKSKIKQSSEIEEVHGIFIDEWSPSNSENVISQEENTKGDTNEKGTDYKEHGVFIDDLEFNCSSSGHNSSSISDSTEKSIDDSELDNILEDLLNSTEDSETENKELDNILDGLLNDVEDSEDNETNDKELDDILDDLFTSVKDEPKTSNINTETIKQQKEEKQEVIVVPTNVRDFIKANQGSSMSYVLQYYSKKDISKAISLGRIYVKGGKLYI